MGRQLAQAPPPSSDSEAEVHGLSDTDKFMLDLQGFLVIRSAMAPDAVADANAAIDAMWDQTYEQSSGEVSRCRSGGHSSEREQHYSSLNGALEWPKPSCLPFRELLANRAVVPALIQGC
jgi:hypothetical protein